MFRRFFSTGKFVSYLGGSAAAATTTVVALSDKELKKKPEWYQTAVFRLEESLKRLGKYRPIENAEVLDNAEDTLTRVSDYNSAELLWRLGRALVEKSELTHDHHEKAHLIEKALEHLHKALSLDAADKCAGCHKWYAMALKKAGKKVGASHSEVVHHLEKAVQIDDKDPFAWLYLGIQHFETKNYKDAVSALQKAENARPEFSAANKYYLGVSQYYNGNRDEALKTLKKALHLPTRNIIDGRSKIRAKEFLLTKLNQKWEDIDPTEDY